MSSDGEAQSIANILSGFSSAESAAEDVIDSILSEGGRELYQRYIARKSFSFASESISHLLIAELKMCFVRHDEGEPRKTPIEQPVELPSGIPQESASSEAAIQVQL